MRLAWTPKSSLNWLDQPCRRLSVRTLEQIRDQYSYALAVRSGLIEPLPDLPPVDFISARTGHLVSETQHASFHAISDEALAAAQQKVMDCFPDRTVLLTRKQISHESELELSSVCGRVRELLKKKRLAKHSKIIAETGKKQELIGLPEHDRPSRYQTGEAT